MVGSSIDVNYPVSALRYDQSTRLRIVTSNMRVSFQIQDAMRLDPRPEFHRVILRAGDNGTIKAHSTGGQRSSRVASLSGANGLVALPTRTERGPEEVPAGSFVDAVVIGEILG